MQADYDTIAEAFSESRADMHWPELDDMISRVDEGSAVLDIGCGTGRLCSQLADKNVHYTGVDISKEQLTKAQQTCPAGEFWQATMTKLPFENQRFDTVFMIASLHHVMTNEQRQQAVNEALRVLKSGGNLYVTVMGLWQKKYWPLFFTKKAGLQTMPARERGSITFTDIFLPWSWKSEAPVYRYYHAFRKSELKNLFDQTNTNIYRCEYVRDNRKTMPWHAKNIVLYAQKMV